MDSEGMAILAVVGVVFVVVVFGLWARGGWFSGSEGVTGMVISEPLTETPTEICGCGPGEPVCAAIGHRLAEYDSACKASCSGAHIIFAGRCSAIPKS